MIFDLTKSYVPESYVESRDYRTFLRQLSMLTSVFKYNIDHLPDLYDENECPDHLLELLAAMVGYDYLSDKSIKSNRKIIGTFPYMLRNRGSALGIKMAAVLSLNTLPFSTRTYTMDNLVVTVDQDIGLINIYYPYEAGADVDWRLIEYVRPIGMRFRAIPSSIGQFSDELDLKVEIRHYERDEYYAESVVDKSQVNRDVAKIIRSQDKYKEAGTQTDPSKYADVKYANVGDEITYVIQYYNYNPYSADVVITDKLDECVDYVNAIPTATYDNITRVVTWTISDVPAFTEGSVNLTVKVNENIKNN